MRTVLYGNLDLLPRPIPVELSRLVQQVALVFHGALHIHPFRAAPALDQINDLLGRDAGGPHRCVGKHGWFMVINVIDVLI